MLSPTIIFIIIWLSAINLVFFLPRYKAWHVYVYWLLACVVCLGFAYGFEVNTRLRPHEAWQSTEIYMLYICASALFALPGFILHRSRRRLK